MLGDVAGSLGGVAGTLVNRCSAIGDAGAVGRWDVPPQHEIASARNAPNAARRMARS
jgi:hypothetical protein